MLSTPSPSRPGSRLSLFLGLFPLALRLGAVTARFCALCGARCSASGRPSRPGDSLMPASRRICPQGFTQPQAWGPSQQWISSTWRQWLFRLV